MRKAVFLLLLFVSLTSFAEWSAYYPNGKKITFKWTRIIDIIDSMHVTEVESFDHKLGMVYFKRLTNKPLFVLFTEKAYPERIPEMIKSYDYEKYLYSFSYYWDLKNMIDSNTLSEDYLIENFGNPDTKTTSESSNGETWIYSKFNLKVNFLRSVATSADVIPYKAILKNKMSILSFDVTGGDYSIGFNIYILNLEDKTIKYVFITVTATNPVNDKIGTKTVRAIGPVKGWEAGSWEFEDLFYSRVAEYLSLDSIRVVFMDGTEKVLNKKTINAIKYVDWEEFGKRTE